MNKFTDNLSRAFYLIVLMAFSAASAAAQSSLVVENNFEKDAQNWEARGPATVKISKEDAASGAKSLKISGRADFWQGAQLNLTPILKGGNDYKFSIAVKLAKKEMPDDVKMTVQRGDKDYDNVGGAKVSADEWTTISGSFKPSGKDASLVVYLEAARPNTAFYIDDFKIENSGSVTPAQSGVLLKTDFEDNTAQNWFARGEGVQIFSSNAAGSQSLKVTGRTQNWEGVGLDVSPLIFKGQTYDVSVSVRLLKGESKDSLKITMLQTPSGKEPTYMEVTPSQEVTDTEWTTLTGKYIATTTNNNLVLYIESANAKTSFYVDNFTLSATEKKITNTKQ